MSAVAQRRFTRFPAIVNGAVVGVVVLVVTILGVSVSQPPPPELAAFAPQLQQVTNHPNNGLSGAAGAGPEGGAGAAAPSGLPGGATPTPAPAPTPNGIPPGSPAVRHCFGNPPRQTPDPQSPPCVPYYDPKANNGGATSPGVTGDTIYVAWPDLGASNCPNAGFFAVEREKDTQDLLAYFNAHFELYNRHVVFKSFCVDSAGFNTDSAQKMQSDADKVARGLNPGTGIFASIGYSPNGGAAYFYYDQLAHDRIISVDSDPMATDHTAQFGPYEWEVQPGQEANDIAIGDLACNQLRGHPPEYAGQPPTPPGSWPAQRKFRIVVSNAGNKGVTVNYAIQPLIDIMSACDPPDGGKVDNLSGSTDAEAASLKQAGVTSVICICAGPALAPLMSSAQNQAYFPEWLVQGSGQENMDSSSSAAGSTSGYPSSEESHIIGINFNNKFDPPENQFWFQAINEVDPAYAYGDNGIDIYDYYRYEQLMVLFAGLQAAGPNLTPDSFAQGLYNDHFSNPGHGAAPYYLASVGFSPSVHYFFNDAAAVWFDASAQNYTTNEPRTGSFCYSRHGQRSVDWRNVSPLFYNNQSCR